MRNFIRGLSSGAGNIWSRMQENGNGRSKIRIKLIQSPEYKNIIARFSW